MPMQYIGCIEKSPGVSEAAGAEFSFCTLRTPPSTYTFKIIGSYGGPAGAARESPSCGWMVSTPKFAALQPKLAGPAREVEHWVECKRDGEAMPELSNRSFSLAEDHP
jgi:hypothetical protein